MDIHTPGARPSIRPPKDYFTGTVWQDPVVAAPAPARVVASRVSFEPGARTAWHTHPLGQTLLVLSGVGLVQVKGGPIREIPRRRHRVVCAGREALARRQRRQRDGSSGDPGIPRRQPRHLDGKGQRRRVWRTGQPLRRVSDTRIRPRRKRWRGGYSVIRS